MILGIEFPGFTVYQYVAFGCITFVYLVFCHKIAELEKTMTPNS
jgi:hypothetical protein